MLGKICRNLMLLSFDKIGFSRTKLKHILVERVIFWFV